MPLSLEFNMEFGIKVGGGNFVVFVLFKEKQTFSPYFFTNELRSQSQ